MKSGVVHSSEPLVGFSPGDGRLDALFQRWPGVIFSQRPDLSFGLVTAGIEEFTGIAPERWQRDPALFWQVIHEADAPELRQQLKRAAQARELQLSRFRVRHVRTGRVTHLVEYRQAWHDEGQRVQGYDGIWLDVTRQAIAERRLATAAWKETLAVLTLGMAHDFANCITGIHGLAESFLAQLDPHHGFCHGLGLIKNSALQASQLVHRMVNLHRNQAGDRNYHNLNDVIADLAELARKIVGRGIQITTEPAPTPLPLYVDVVELRQVILNLMMNATDAMPKGGRLTLRTSTHEKLPALEHVRGIAPRLPAVCLTVQDTGSGINPRHLEMIFDPFFTTKAAHKGSGLGLYNACLFVEKHHGCLSVTSREGLGSTFQIWLPQADFSEEERSAFDGAEGAITRHTILLAGSAGPALERMTEMLRSAGYYVVPAASPDGASDALNAEHYQLDAALLLAEPGEAAFQPFMAEARQQARQSLKLIVKAVGCDLEALDPELSAECHLVAAGDMADPDFLAKLKNLLRARS